ncbi:hypothetical protein MMC13_002772 [Lambiella insularis]|nr:hypothetical protein [Lambiella insularis]
MEKQYQYNEEDIPSYEDATFTSSANATAEFKPGPQRSLVQRLADVRQNRINAIIESHVNPLLKQQAEDGLLKSTFILVPSNTSTLQSSIAAGAEVFEGCRDVVEQSSTETVIGFREGEHVKLVRLHGEEYTEEFWRQPAVISELNEALKTRLQAEGHRIAQPSTSLPDIQIPNLLVPSSSVSAKKGFFGWKKRAGEQVLAPDTNPTGWRFEREEVLPPGEVRIKTGLQDVSLRVQNQMGLFETRTGKAVVINFEM